LISAGAWDDATVDWNAYDFVVVRTTWDYSVSERRAAQFRQWVRDLAAKGIFVWNHPRIISWNISKRYLQELHEAAGIPVIPTVHAVPGAPVPDLRLLMKKHGWRSLIIKPCVSAGSRCSVRVLGGDEKAMDRAQKFLEDMLTVGFDTSKADSSVVAASAPTHVPLHHALTDTIDRDLKIPSVEETQQRAVEIVSAYIAPPSQHDGPVEQAVPCEMMIQPYIRSVESLGELSVITIDGKITHAVSKKPVAGDFKTQEEYGGLQAKVQLTADEAGTVSRILTAAKSIVEKYELPSTPISPAQIQDVLPHVLPADALMVARVDFLRLTPEAYEDVFEAGASGTVERSVKTSDARCEGTSPIATVSRDSLLLLELEVIEPALFLSHHPEAAEALATAIEQRLHRHARHPVTH
jgi:hypothetical protein